MCNNCCTNDEIYIYTYIHVHDSCTIHRIHLLEFLHEVDDVPKIDPSSKFWSPGVQEASPVAGTFVSGWCDGRHQGAPQTGGTFWLRCDGSKLVNGDFINHKTGRYDIMHGIMMHGGDIHGMWTGHEWWHNTIYVYEMGFQNYQQGTGVLTHAHMVFSHTIILSGVIKRGTLNAPETFHK